MGSKRALPCRTWARYAFSVFDILSALREATGGFWTVLGECGASEKSEASAEGVKTGRGGVSSVLPRGGMVFCSGGV